MSQDSLVIADFGPSPTLNTIPAELVAHIVVFLDPSSIQGVLRTCKRIYDVALPLSVRTFKSNYQLSSIHPEAYSKDESTAECIRLYRFLRYVAITKPELAKEVRILDIPTLLRPHVKLSMPFPEDIDAYRQMTAAVSSLRPYSGLIHTLSGSLWGSWLGAITLLVLICPKLERLHVPTTVSRFLRPTVLPQLSEAEGSTDDQRPLSHLREWHHRCWTLGSHRADEYEITAAFLRLPRLVSFEASHAVFKNSVDMIPSSIVQFSDFMPQGSSSVERIYLHYSRLDPGMMGLFTQASKGLRSFYFTRALTLGIGDRLFAQEVMPRDLMEGIVRHADTLESLCVDFDDDSAKSGWPQRPERICLGTDLQKMTALKMLATGMQALTGMLHKVPYDDAWRQTPLEVEGAPTLVQCLPDNLEQLEIHGCSGKILAQAQELLDAISSGSRFRRLRRVSLIFGAGWIKPSDVALTCGSPSTELRFEFLSNVERWRRRQERSLMTMPLM